ncbi:PPK2 family polyphosphate kinase [Massilia cavernae]|uniref:Polyphosphate kinase 2 family protein n=1 Tax=Massilia cavernae TaxID=2320864 RepID=A0A418XTC5_9BURK|nr:PPK2 family polyphosphate kinase [Massilia cavernae]RJG15899.1 polyphosphate kinase 2 family protein [Massilia cavernae]
MKARKLLRAPKDLTLRDEDAAATPLRDELVEASMSSDEIKQKAREQTAQITDKIAVYQEMLYAARKHKVLLVLQGMDTAGKDSTIKSLFSHINPMGLRAVAFRRPNEEELAHDYLWRVHKHTPQCGEIAIFNRSHYEDVVTVRVLDSVDDKEAARRFIQIRDFERMLAETGTVIVKIFLHISKGEQRKRLQQRLDDPEKQWKYDPADLAHRKLWDKYQAAYQEAIVATDADNAPWYIIPADSKPQRDLAIATLLLEIMESLKLAFPKPDPKLAKLKIPD